MAEHWTVEAIGAEVPEEHPAIRSWRRLRPEGQLQVLLEPPLTIIHGEYYGRNILVQDGVIYPVDWELAAMAAGEIDLASLTDQWPSSITEQCEVAYQQARWPQGTPASLKATCCCAALPPFSLAW
jgi:thiamine kinase-like enzyme